MFARACMDYLFLRFEVERIMPKFSLYIAYIYGRALKAQRTGKLGTRKYITLLIVSPGKVSGPSASNNFYIL